MNHPAIALQEYLHNRLTGSAEIETLLGGKFIFDDVPSSRKPPYLIFAQAKHVDWSTDDQPGTEHFLTIEAWSKRRGRKQVLEIAGLVEASLHGLADNLQDHELVHMIHEFTDVEQDEKTGLFVARLNFRAITEPA